MPDPLVINNRITLSADELLVRTMRSSGPGGQHVNKVESAVEIRVDLLASDAFSNNDKARLVEVLGSRLSGDGRILTVRASAHRSQRRNLDAARERLASMLRAALKREKARRATKPTRGSQRRRLDSKKKRGDLKRQRRSGRGDE